MIDFAFPAALPTNCNHSHLPSTLGTNVDVEEEKLKALVGVRLITVSHQ